MNVGPASLILALLVPAAWDQETGSIEGRVTSSANHAGISGATVSAGSQRNTTGASGEFRIADLASGDYTLSFEAAGFFKSESKVRLGAGGTPASVSAVLVPYSSISGRVLDADGNPAAGVTVEFTESVRGTGTTMSILGVTTDSEGRYSAEQMPPGVYLARVPMGSKPALPSPKPREGERRVWVSTYYPSTSDRGEAAGLALTGGTPLSGCDVRLMAAPVHAIRGRVYDDRGEPVNAAVKVLRAALWDQPQAQAQAHGGVFEIPDVPAGDWTLVAEAERAGTGLKGVAQVTVGRDVEDLVLHLAAPFAYQAFVEPRGKADAHVELHPLDVPPGEFYVNAENDSEGVVRFQAVYPGRYRVNVFADAAGYYLDSILFGEQEVLGRDISLAEGAPPLRVVFQPDTAGLRGTVQDCNQNCSETQVLVFPEDESLWDFRFIRHSSCDRAGHFQTGGLRPGRYYAVALDRIDETGLDRLATLRRLAAIAALVEIEAGRVAQLELKVVAWPE